MIKLGELAEAVSIEQEFESGKPVIEKEIVHYEIIRCLSAAGLLDDLTFQGGTALRLCHGAARYSEDLDFAAGGAFESLKLEEFTAALRKNILSSYDADVTVKEPKITSGSGGGVAIRRWKISIDTAPARKDLPKQRIKVEIASVPAYTGELKAVRVNYPQLAGAYDGLRVRCESLEEVLADKLIAFAATEESRIRYRDLWDISWLLARIDPSGTTVAGLVEAKHGDYNLETPLSELISKGAARARSKEITSELELQMGRFLPPRLLRNAFRQTGSAAAMGADAAEAYSMVAADLGLRLPAEESATIRVEKAKEERGRIDVDAVKPLAVSRLGESLENGKKRKCK